MSLYLLVEGDQTEPLIYASWLEHCLPTWQRVDRVEDISDKTFFMISGKGYPSYLKRIKAAVSDVHAHGVRWLWICIDSEDMSYDEKVHEIRSILDECPSFHGTRVIVQHCCIETWLLGNAKIVKRMPETEPLRSFMAHYNVVREDPEKMPSMDGFDTRAGFHLAYLRKAFEERGDRYAKNNPGGAKEHYYLRELIRRQTTTKHIPSFGSLVSALQELGAAADVLGIAPQRA
ncbi:MAG: hypothetical protein IPM54_25900 [Polyangiaceae bacterium]|nr:hypothetical protein [Polyangiaceae bacterium]